MAQQESRPPHLSIPEFQRGTDDARREAIANSKLTREFLDRYRRYADRAGEDRRVGGPGGPVIAVADLTRLIVKGHVSTPTHHRPRAEDWLAQQGASVVDVIDDERIGISQLSVKGIEPEALYAALVALAHRDPTGEEPLALGVDDVTAQAEWPPKVIAKPITGQSGSGAPSRIAIDARRPLDTGRGKGITVAVIDGGFDPDGPARGDGWYDNVTGPADGVQRLDVEITDTLDPGAGHGPFVTGLIVQHAPDVAVRQYVATDSFGLGSSWRLKDCILQAYDEGCRIINISLGFTDPDLIGSPALSAVLHHLPPDVLVVAAAGNGGTVVPMLPASHKAAIAVGGLDGGFAPLDWSNHGPWVDVAAVACPVISTFVPDPGDPDAYPDPWALWSGTSFAAPKVAGELAALLSQGLSAQEAVGRLRESAVRPHPDPNYGYLLGLADQVTPQKQAPDLVDGAVLRARATDPSVLARAARVRFDGPLGGGR